MAEANGRRVGSPTAGRCPPGWGKHGCIGYQDCSRRLRLRRQCRSRADASAKSIEFNKIPAWDRRSVIEKGGWATMPGNDGPNSAVVTACAERLARPL